MNSEDPNVGYAFQREWCRMTFSSLDFRSVETSMVNREYMDGGFKYFVLFTANLGEEMIPFDVCIFFQMGLDEYHDVSPRKVLQYCLKRSNCKLKPANLLNFFDEICRFKILSAQECRSRCR